MSGFDLNKIIQTSPVAHAQSAEPTKWEVINGMKTAVEFSSLPVEEARRTILGICDVSCFSRFGVKGLGAAQWLNKHGIEIPNRPNSWITDKQNTLILRLGSSEFLVEDPLNGSTFSKLAADPTRVETVYKVPRADASFIVSGSDVLNLFSEVCSLDLSEKSLFENDLMMTQIAGISATVLRQALNGEQIYRIWCDGTYGSYMWQVLTEIANELGGGAVGLSSYQS